MSITYNYTGTVQIINLSPGSYQIECYGASGGDYSGGAGKGGYTSGIINIDALTTFYLYIGQRGDLGNTTRTCMYNGGGAGYHSSGQRGSGGGATDIRINQATTSDPTDDFNSLKSRIMVAAGGGGGYSGTALKGDGGGLIGLGGNGTSDGRPGTQLAGGLWPYTPSSVVPAHNGEFGKGGLAALSATGSNLTTCGGGGGYYGGSVGNNAAGGSSFISGHLGCDAIASSSTSSSIIHTGQPNHYSGIVFFNTNTVIGQNVGDGKIIITDIDFTIKLKALELNNNQYVMFINGQSHLLI